MARFNRGETVEIRLWTRDPDTDALFTPSDVPTLVVTDPNGDEFQASDVMTLISTGYYTYKLPTDADSPLGSYQVLFTVEDSGSISLDYGSFELGR